jgi:polysaccharide pyruvyl transferase CsaB
MQASEPKHIIISGYYGFSNTGDEAVLCSIIEGLRQRSKDIKITVLSAAPQETSARYGVCAVNRDSFSAVRRAMAGGDMLISGGGSLIQNVTSSRSLAYYLGVIGMAKYYGLKVMILAQGLGPLKGRTARAASRLMLDRADLITVRDAPSSKLLMDIGVRRPPVRVTADPALNLSPVSSDVAERLLQEAGIAPGSDVIAVALRNWPSFNIESLAADTLAEIEKSLKARVLLLNMHHPKDSELSARIACGTNFGMQPRVWSAPELLGVLGQCQFVVGMRLHALIFAASMLVPFLGISYDPKVQHFLTACGQESMTLDQVLSEGFAERLTTAWEQRSELAARLSANVPSMRRAAEENIDLALSLLGG